MKTILFLALCHYVASQSPPKGHCPPLKKSEYKMFKPYTKSDKGETILLLLIFSNEKYTGCPCWWDMSRKTGCACCKKGTNAMQCGYPMHHFCYKNTPGKVEYII